MENLIKFILNLPDGEEKNQLLDLATKNTPAVVKPNDIGSGVLIGKCPRCGKPFITSYGKSNYCPECGQRVKFEDVEPI